MKQTKRRVLLVGKFSSDEMVYTYPTSFIGAFEKNGCDVVMFNVKDGSRVLARDDREESIDKRENPSSLPFRIKKYISKILYSDTPLPSPVIPGQDPGSILSSYLSKIVPQFLKTYLLNRRLINTVRRHKPDILFMIKGSMITAAALKKIKQLSPHTHIFHFYPDNPFCFWNGNSNKNVLKALLYIDTFLIWSKQLIPVLKAVGCRRVEYFPFAVDETVYYKIDPRSESGMTREDAWIASDTVFVGTWDTEREQMLERVVQALPQLNLAIWGNRWEEHLSSSSLLRKHLRGTAIYKDTLLKTFTNSKIVLNFIRLQNMQAHNMRTFEALAAGSFLLTQKTDEQSLPPFIPDYNIACFSDTEDLIKKIAFYVNQDSLRKEVALRGYELAHGFTLHARVRTLLDTYSHEGM